MNLPLEFTERMKKELGDEYEEFILSYDREAYKALRVNTLKLDVDEFKKNVDFIGEGVPWCREGFYYEGKKGNHPSAAAGLFYSQEPSAMITAEAADIKEGDYVLDLCAAPGGKSTQIAAKLNNTGLLVSNEVVLSRAKILCENMERFGAKNAVITNMYPEKMEKYFKGYFDRIIADAPCSGEGMFRKDEAARLEWSIEHTLACALRQRAILESSVKMLRCGGTLVYSTCTFAREENELLCEEFSRQHNDIELVSMEKMLPHRVKGEGHFCAKFIKKGNAERTERAFSNGNFPDAKRLYREFEKENLNTELDGEFILFGNFLYLLPYGFGSIDGIKLVRPGLQLGEIRKGRFVPSHHLCIALKKDDFKRSIYADDFDAAAYMRGEVLYKPSEKGYGAVLYLGKYPLGWYKYSDGCAKNHYPKYLRG